MVNGGIHGFVKAAALELPRGIRVNAVCAGLVEDSADRFKEFFAGHTPVPMQEVVRAYKDCLEGDFTGQIVRVWPEQFGR
jgi:NAD(P)-dependent dehydrogenase (short-subunit alcohol dehydrogenase family)